MFWLGNYEYNQFHYKIWITTDVEKSEKYLFFNFENLTQPKNVYGNLKFLIIGTVEKFFMNKSIHDMVTIRLDGIEIWSVQPGLSSTKSSFDDIL